MNKYFFVYNFMKAKSLNKIHYSHNYTNFLYQKKFIYIITVIRWYGYDAMTTEAIIFMSHASNFTIVRFRGVSQSRVIDNGPLCDLQLIWMSVKSVEGCACWLSTPVFEGDE